VSGLQDTDLKEPKKVKQDNHDDRNPHKPSENTLHDLLHLLLLWEERVWGGIGSFWGGHYKTLPWPPRQPVVEAHKRRLAAPGRPQEGAFAAVVWRNLSVGAER
jgi:hypothetical protein